MKINFYKYQGTGNDFIIIDNRQLLIDKNNTKRIAELCERRFGIGADGFILLEPNNEVDFNMVYYNADGNQSSMCGNGGRCIVAFAKFLNLIVTETSFMAIDGLHHAKISGSEVQLQMKDVSDITTLENHLFLDTGSPHHVEMVDNAELVDVKQQGATIRYSDLYNEAGANINFVEHSTPNTFKVRTYERGVEDETFSCGTGVTAVALAMHSKAKLSDNIATLITKGGTLKVRFNFENNTYTNIWLIGEAKQVYKGEIEW